MHYIDISSPRIMDNSYPRQLVPRTTRTQDNSYPGLLAPKTARTQDNSYPRQLVPRTTRTQQFGYYNIREANRNRVINHIAKGHNNEELFKIKP